MHFLNEVNHPACRWFIYRFWVLVIIGIATITLPAVADESAINETITFYGLRKIVENDPFISAMTSSNQTDLSLLIPTNQTNAFPYGMFGTLHMAALLGNSQVVARCLTSGVPVDDRKGLGLPTALHVAVIGGHDQIVHMLLEAGADPMLKIGEGMSAFPLAALHGRTSIMPGLVEHGAELDAPGGGGMTPLAIATRQGHMDTMAWLVDRGANVHTRNRHGMNLLRHAVRGNHVDVMTYLLSQGVDPSEVRGDDVTPLMLAAKSGHVATAEPLARNPVHVNATNRFGVSAVYYAVVGKKQPMVEWLTENGADLSVRDQAGQGLVHWAVINNDQTLVTWLGDRGADLNLPDNAGLTPLMLAVERSLIPAARALIAAGADVNLADGNQVTPLIRAVQKRDKKMIGILLEAHANVHATLADGQTALMVAAAHGDPDMLIMLTNAGANLHARTNKKASVLNIAMNASRLDNFICLLEQGFDVKSGPEHGVWAIVLSAAWQGKKEFVEASLLHGSDVNTVDDEGQSALFVAVRRSHQEVARFLLEQGAETALREKGGATAWHVAVDRNLDALATELASRMTPEQLSPTNRILMYFDLDAPTAQRVSVAGLFNEWNSERHPMQRRDDDGWWYTEVEVFPVGYSYKLVVDGQWIVDPVHANTEKADPYGDRNSWCHASERTPDQRPVRPPSRADRLTQVVFTYDSAQAQSVHVAGEFNGWNTTALPMKKSEAGQWTASTMLGPGHYGYKLVVDGVWTMDPLNPHTKVVGKGTNSLLVVEPKSIAR